MNIYLARHGETPWTVTGQHTGLNDLALTERGERHARALGERLKGHSFARVLTSTLQRAARTCELAGFASIAEVDPRIVEWDYGEYEGKTRVEIRQARPGWMVFNDGCPGGETVAAVGARADQVIADVRQSNGDVLLFSHGHFLRVLAARWLGLDPSAGKHFLLSTTSVSILGYEHGDEEPVIRLWNDHLHVQT